MDDAWITQLGLGRLVRTRSVLGYVVAPALGKLERRADRVASVFKLESDILGFNPGISHSWNVGICLGGQPLCDDGHLVHFACLNFFSTVSLLLQLHKT